MPRFPSFPAPQWLPLRLRSLCAGLLTLLLVGQPSLARADIEEKDGQALYLEALQAIAEGRKSDASAMLTRLIEESPRHVGGLLDLALLQCELGHAQEAEHLFQLMESRTQLPAVIVEVIAGQRKIGCTRAKYQRNYSFSLARGYDQNVNQGASNPNFTIGRGDGQTEVQLSPDFLPRADQYTLLEGSYTQNLSQNGALGFVQGVVRQNDRLSRYNNLALSFGAEQAWHSAQWSGRVSAMLSFLSLGGQLYQRQTQLAIKATPPLKLPERWQFNLSTGVSHIQYLTLTNYNSSTADIRGNIAYFAPQTVLQASVGYTLDIAAQQRPGGDRKGWLTTAQWRNQIKDDVTGEIGWSRQTWRGQSAFSPGLIDENRNQETHILRASLQYALAPHQSVQLEWRQTYNRENISIFQYSNRQLQLSWQWQR